MRLRAETVLAALAMMVAGCGSDAAPLPAAQNGSDDVPAVTLRPPASATGASQPPEVASATGPAATAGNGAAAGYDAVGYASWYGDGLEGATTASGAPFANAGMTAAHRTLPLGSYAEVTALDTGRTILVRITDRGPTPPDREIDLSTAAARSLGTAAKPLAPVRVRSVAASPADAAAIAQGQAASPRLDTPEAVLRPLRRQLPAPTRALPTPVAPVAVPPGVPLTVQIAAFSNEARAKEVAASFHGRVETADGLWRVRVGPLSTAAEAKRVRDAAVSRGYGDAAILRDR
ncbi:septal ring lytic transglycosylase RlpA family protein [Sphingomonas ginsenosidimutans]|jgi:rare lipoprotein A|nr:septal ring lytic transglycosylase RlpA family protein [Sphingomonas ginsenosidimutans]